MRRQRRDRLKVCSLKALRWINFILGLWSIEHACEAGHVFRAIFTFTAGALTTTSS
jgi:hypothetical protein